MPMERKYKQGARNKLAVQNSITANTNKGKRMGDSTLHTKPYTRVRQNDDRVLLFGGNRPELSFIDTELAIKLALPILEEKSLLIHTFGSQDPVRKICNTIMLDIFDILYICTLVIFLLRQYILLLLIMRI
uniref:2-phosphosulfolactate phosphatase n=1 Tax=Heterorhabditis bacteriophora TaxID=37862 RepID=A0A1I7WER8_HETBA